MEPPSLTIPGTAHGFEGTTPDDYVVMVYHVETPAELLTLETTAITVDPATKALTITLASGADEAGSQDPHV